MENEYNRKESVEALVKVYDDNSDETLMFFDDKAFDQISEIMNTVPEDEQGIVFHMFQMELQMLATKRGVNWWSNEGTVH